MKGSFNTPFLLILLLIVACVSSASATYDPCITPVVLVPGLGGCVLDVFIEKEYKFLHDICALAWPKNKWTSGLARLWPAIEAVDDIYPHYLRDCWEDMMQVHFDASTMTFNSTKGIQVRPRDYGGVSGIDNLFDVTSSWGPGIGAVYEKLIKALKAVPGFEVGQNIRGAPYDFRMAASEEYIMTSFAELQNLIEDTYNRTLACSSGPKAVNVMTHSLGGPYFLYYLNVFVSQAWKDKYLKSFISVSAPWQGAAKAFRTTISGDSEGLPGLNSAFLPVEQVMGGLLWMFPFSNFFHNKIFVEVGEERYSVNSSDVSRLFNSLTGDNRQLVPIIFNTFISPRTLKMAAPSTDLYCIHGYGLVTESYYVYTGVNATTADPVEYREDYVVNGTVVIAAPDPNLKLPLSKASPYFSDENQGDATVEIESLEFCTSWYEKNNGHTVKHIPLANQDHLGILSSDAFIQSVLPLLTQP